MPYTLFFRPEKGDISLKDFQKIFEKHENCRVVGNEAFYENPDTGAGFTIDYMAGNDKGEEHVRSEGTYRIAVSVNYSQVAFFFVEALYLMRWLVDKHNMACYNPQLTGKAATEPFDEKVLFEDWEEINGEAIREYMVGLGDAMDDVPVFSYEAVRLMWEWNFSQKMYRKEIEEYITIPLVVAVDFCGEEKTAVFWRNGEPIAIPEVDVVILSRGEGEKVENVSVEFSEISGFVDKYSTGTIGNAMILSYKETPKDIAGYFKTVDNDNDFTVFDMCEILEYEVARDSLFLSDDEDEEE